MPRVNGRRGWFLILNGVLYVAIGASYTFAPAHAPVREAMRWLPWFTPLELCGLFWVGAGLVALWCAFRPIPKDKAGFQACAGVSLGWSVAYAVSSFVGATGSGWVGFLVFAVFAASILVVSGMVNPVRKERDG